MELSSEAIIAHALQNAPRSSLARHTHLRSIYLAFYLIATIVLIPLWAFQYFSIARRPRQSWSIWRSLRVRVKRRLCAAVALCEIDYLGRDLSIEMVKFSFRPRECGSLQDPTRLSYSTPITIPPAPQTHLRGYSMEMMGYLHHNVGSWVPPLIPREHCSAFQWDKWNKPGTELGFAPVRGFWYSNPLRKEVQKENVILNFHGGGYLCGTAAEHDLTASIPKKMLRTIDQVFSVDYRLAPEAPWPLPLLDAISAYQYLLDQGWKSIVLMGDSAGAHLALALMRFIREEGGDLGMTSPCGMILASPWADVGFTSAWGEGLKHNADSDVIDDSFGPFATSLLLRALPSQLMHTDPYLSPAGLLAEGWSFEGFPPVFMIAGGAERLSRSIRLLWQRLRSCRTERDQFLEVPDAVHDFLIFPWMAKESALVYKELDEWLRDLLALPPMCDPKPHKSPILAAIAQTQRMLQESEHKLVDSISNYSHPNATKLMPSLSNLPPLEL